MAGLQLPEEFQGGFIVSSHSVGAQKMYASGHSTAVPENKEYSHGQNPVVVASVASGMNEKDAKQGSIAMDETAGQFHPIASMMGKEMKAGGVHGLQEGPCNPEVA